MSERFNITTTYDYIHICLEGTGIILVSRWLPFRRWRIQRAHRKLLQLKADLAYAKNPAEKSDDI